MKCPNCLVEINPNFQEEFLGNDNEGYWSIFKMICPNPTCNKFIIKLGKGSARKGFNSSAIVGIEKITEEILVKPLTASRSPVSLAVDSKYATDYKESCLIISFSPKASAALSRRCLQNILREKAGVKKSNLANEIQEIISTGLLPTYLSESIDAIRNIGNFAAHPLKSTSTGEIIDVEYGEAEWLLDVLESLFDFYFVQPTLLQIKKDALNKKLTEIGKPLMK